MAKSVLIIGLFLTCYAIVSSSSLNIPESPSQIEYLTVDHFTHKSHRRDKRSAITTTPTTSSSNVDHELHLHALGRKFHMLLQQKEDILAPNFRISIVNPNGTEEIFHHDHSHLLPTFYRGHLAGNRNAKVAANIDLTTGIVTGSIDDPDDDKVFYIEPTSHLDAPSNVNNSSMVIYSYNKNDASNVESKFCDSINLKNDPEIASILKNASYTNKQRSKRSESPLAEKLVFKRPNRCAIRLVADTSFYKRMSSDIKRTVNYVVSVIDRINGIYTSTNFGDTPDSELQNFGFLIQEVSVLKDYVKDENHHNREPKDSEQMTISSLLDKFSAERSHKWFCLNHLFTHTQFREGVLGLAYVANPRKAVPGGICSGKVIRNGKEFFYNTGVTSTKNSFGKAIFTRITDLITAHELGHNWGAEHDPDLKDCSPSSSEGGPFLMHTYSLNGYEANNKLFSPCSKRSIANVLAYRSQSCFLPDTDIKCGNGVVEGNEECDANHIADARTPDSEHSDPCCTIECKLKPDAQCSDLNHLCCDKCKIRSRGSLCREKNSDSCKDATVCDGFSKNCPAKSPPLPDGRQCLDDGTCLNGQCKSVCEIEGKIPCICHQRKDQFCLRCCRSRGSNSTCSPHVKNSYLPNGSPCLYGFCDEGKCKKAPQDVVKRLWDIIKSSSFNSFLKLLVDNLVIVSIIVLALIYIPCAMWLNSRDKKTIEKISTLNTHRATPSFRRGQGDSVEMARLNPNPSAPNHPYYLRSSNRTDVPDEVDFSPSNDKKEDLNCTTVDLQPRVKLDTTD